MKAMNYESPVVEVIEVEVEKGFATSGDGENGHWQNDADNAMYDEYFF